MKTMLFTLQLRRVTPKLMNYTKEQASLHTFRVTGGRLSIGSDGYKESKNDDSC